MAKNIMLCCDGTGNECGKNNTNVAKIFLLWRKKINRKNKYSKKMLSQITMNEVEFVD